MLIPGGIAAALILIAMLAMNFANKGFTQAFKVLCGDIETRVGASVFAVSGPLSRCLENGEVYTDISYTDEYGDTISGILSYASDSGAHRLSLDARIYGNPLDAVLLVNEDHAALGSSLLGDSYFGVRFDTFAEDFAKFADIAGLSGVSADGYAEIVRMIDCAFNGGASLSAGTAAQLKKILTDFLSGLKSCESREKMSSGGRPVTSSVLTYTATVSDLADLGDRLVSSARSDESMRSFLTAYMRSQGIYEDYGYAAVPDPAASVSTLNSFHTVEASEPVDYFLDELEYLLKAARENCSGDISVRLISIKGRFSAIELSAEVYAEGEPLSVWLQLD
ncbi:MAG: hypothetical protein GX823_06360, partial [Clostridiales bacterium]|nr:hypothetical protein [Clostridiales bacterium]